LSVERLGWRQDWRLSQVIAARVHGLDIDGLELHAPGDRDMLHCWQARGVRGVNARVHLAPSPAQA